MRLGPSCVSVPPKVFAPRKHTTLAPGLSAATILFCLQCTNYTDSQQIILFCPTKCQHFGKIPRKTVFAVCKFSRIANKSSWSVLLNASIWWNIAENRLCDPQVYSNLSNSNYRIFVKEILLEIGFIEIGFISSNWPATRPHYSFGAEKIGPSTIKLAHTLTSPDKTSQR